MPICPQPQGVVLVVRNNCSIAVIQPHPLFSGHATYTGTAMIEVAETCYLSLCYPVIYPVPDEFSGGRSTDFIDFFPWWGGAKELNGELGTISSNTDKKLVE